MRSICYVGIILIALCSITVAAFAEEAEHEHSSTPFPALNEFHDVVVKIWHEYFPVDNWSAVRQAVPDLQKRMKALQEAQLPAGFSSQADAYKAKLADLTNSVNELAEAAKGDDDEKLNKSVVKMHTAYHSLIRILFAKKQN